MERDRAIVFDGHKTMTSGRELEYSWSEAAS